MNKNKGKIKIVILTNDLLIGGVQKLVIDQITLLDANKFEFTVISLIQFPSKGTFYDLVPSHVKLYKLNFKGIGDMGQWIKLFQILKKIRPNIVKSSLFFSNTIARILKPLVGYKVIVAEHNTEIRRRLSYKIINWLLAPLAWKIVADSRTVADFVSKSEYIKKNKFVVIYNGVELKVIEEAKKNFAMQKDAIRKEIGLGSDDVVFLNIAHISTQKNHQLMIDGFARFSNTYANAKLVIIGDGLLMPHIKERITQLGLTEKVILLGERRDIYRFYSIADFFLLTSIREGFCISAMNALAFGVPVITTRVAGLIEYIQDGVNGFFIENNAADLAIKLDTATTLSKEQRSEMGNHAMLTAQHFSIEKYVATYEQLFHDCFEDCV